MQVVTCLPNSCRTLEAPTPTNISSNSEPEQKKKGTSASPAMALANRVFPVPGGPTKRMPTVDHMISCNGKNYIHHTPGKFCSKFLEFFWVFEEFDHLIQFFFSFIDLVKIMMITMCVYIQ